MPHDSRQSSEARIAAAVDHDPLVVAVGREDSSWRILDQGRPGCEVARSDTFDGEPVTHRSEDRVHLRRADPAAASGALSAQEK